VLSYLVAQRNKEIGIRLALGASRRAIVSLVLRHSVRLAALGIGTGLLIALPLARFLVAQVQIPTLKPFDGPAFLIAVAIVLLAATGAAYVPTRRAVSVNPLEILRHE
jgi:ABC-type antimicrobial peptide transport system permease subunit